jgi:3-hexulose-6-phosphate synthase
VLRLPSPVLPDQGSGRTIVQVSIDVSTTEEAIAVATMAVNAGVDWLEVGTPLVLAQGMRVLADLVPRFPDHTFFVDAKLVDSARRSVMAAADLGADLIAVCGIATDATIREAVAGARDSGIKVVVDLYGAADPVARGTEVAALGADLVYLHYGADQMLEDPGGDRTVALLPGLKSAVSIPVGVVTFDIVGAVAAVEAGADIVLIGHPYLIGPDALAMLTKYVQHVRAARPRRPGGSN